MKKTIAILLAMLVIIGCASVAVVSAATASVNVNGKDYNFSQGGTMTYTVKIQTPVKVENGQFDIHYPNNILKVESVEFPLLNNVLCNYEQKVTDEILFNFSNASGYEKFMTTADLVVVKFNVIGTGSGNLTLDKLVMCNMDDANIINQVSFTEVVEGADAETTPIVAPTAPVEDPTEAPTQASPDDPSVQPTQPPTEGSEDHNDQESKPALSAAMKIIKAGAAFTLGVTGNKGAVSFKSDKAGVAKVSKTGVVTGITQGKANITATVDGKTLTCRVVVSTKPKLSKSSITVKKGKSATVKITGKAKSIKNKYKNTKIAKVTSKKTATKIKVKGLKKGKTTLTITVNGKVKLKLKVKVK